MSVAAIKELVDEKPELDRVLKCFNGFFSFVERHPSGCVVVEINSDDCISFANFPRIFEHVRLGNVLVGSWWLNNKDRRQATGQSRALVETDISEAVWRRLHSLGFGRLGDIQES